MPRPRYLLRTQKQVTAQIPSSSLSSLRVGDARLHRDPADRLVAEVGDQAAGVLRFRIPAGGAGAVQVDGVRVKPVRFI